MPTNHRWATGHLRRRWRASVLVACLFATPATVGDQADAHIFIFPFQRAGAASCGPGTGWNVECFHAIPAASASHLLTAEVHADMVPPTFTFDADFLDWPAGPVDSDLDTAFATMGDFLDGHITAISDPNALNLPFDHFLLRARGYLNVRVQDTAEAPPTPPVWLDFGLLVYDGGRVRIDTTTIFRLVVPSPPPGFFSENAIVALPGAYPIEITYFQRYDPAAVLGTERAGFEYLGCYANGLTLPSGGLMPCPPSVTGTGTPPALIYSAADIGLILPGDFDVDNDFDLQDVARMQSCFTGPGFEGFWENNCDEFDVDGDNDADIDDWNIMIANFVGPAVCIDP